MQPLTVSILPMKQLDARIAASSPALGGGGKRGRRRGPLCDWASSRGQVLQHSGWRCFVFVVFLEGDHKKFYVVTFRQITISED